MIGPSTHTFIFSSESNIIANQAATTTLTLLHVPPTGGSYLKVTVSGGTNNSGTVTITGTLSGVAKTDTLTWTAARWQISANQYDVITSITTANLANEATKPTVLVESCYQDGTKKTWSSTNTYYGRFKNTAIGSGMSAMLQAISAGQKAVSLFSCTIDTDADINLGDIFTVNFQNDSYQVWSEPVRKFQVGTDLVDSISFFATIKSK